MKNIALVVGATGITGSNIAEKLMAKGWTTYGLSRNPNTEIPGLKTISADLLNPDDLAVKLADVAPTHVFFTSWMRNWSRPITSLPFWVLKISRSAAFANDWRTNNQRDPLR